MPGWPGALRRADRSLISASSAARSCCSLFSSALAASIADNVLVSVGKLFGEAVGPVSLVRLLRSDHQAELKL